MMAQSRMARVRAQVSKEGLSGLGVWAARWVYWKSGLYRTEWHFRPPLRDPMYLDRLEETREGRERSMRFLREHRVRHKVIRLPQLRLKVDLKDYAVGRKLFFEHIWEPYESALFLKQLHAGMNVLDIGAHIGYYALHAARAVGKTGHVFAFEPAPENFALLSENVRLNHLQKILTVENLAVSDRAQTLVMSLSNTNTGDHRIYATNQDDDALFNKNAPRATHQVQAIAMDEYLKTKNVARIDVIKMDVQGAEMQVLRGMCETLRANPNVILFFEYWQFGLQGNGTPIQAPLEFLEQEVGMQLFYINSETERVEPKRAREIVEWASTLDPTVQVDLIAARRAPAQGWQ